MSSYPNVAAKETGSSFIAPALAFQRGEGVLRASKAPKRVSVRAKHIVMLFALMAGLSYSICRAYLFVITWDKLVIRNVVIACPRPALQRDLVRAFQGIGLGNILLCDIERLRVQLRSFAWVKEARIRKIFPSSIRVEVVVREPKALIQRYGLALIDAEGVDLGRPALEDTDGLPVLTDAEGFRTNVAEKLALAWDCLDGLGETERIRVADIDLSNPSTVDLRFKDDPVTIRLGDRDFGDKVRSYLEHRSGWEEQFGILDYVDLRFDDRVYIKSHEPEETGPLPGSVKEAE